VHHEELIYSLEQLDPETPLTVSHIIAVLKCLEPVINKAKESEPAQQATTSDQDNLLDTNQLSAMLNVPVETIKYWRKANRGPQITYVGASVRYRLGDVRDYIKKHTVANAAQGRTLNLKEKKKALGIKSFAITSDFDVRPVMLYGEEEVDFFDSLERDENPTGYRLYYSDTPFPLSDETRLKLQDVLKSHKVH
jgi:hypothetical protein